MSWWQSLFGQAEQPVSPNAITTGAALERLAESNQVVAGEVASFRAKRQNLQVAHDEAGIVQQAERSAQLLSGYGIMVTKAAFLEVSD